MICFIGYFIGDNKLRIDQIVILLHGLWDNFWFHFHFKIFSLQFLQKFKSDFLRHIPNSLQKKMMNISIKSFSQL